jgi:prevent-host-death family protein
MKSMPISKFKATCLAVLEQVRRTHRPVLVTRRGQPVAEIVPPRAGERGPDWLGAMQGTGEIVGDIVSPAVAPHEWSARRP